LETSENDSLALTCEGKQINAPLQTIDGKTTSTFKDQVMIKAEQSLTIVLKFTK
jgi:hypothetical protein